jgi:signal transduction histidine kinase
VGSEIYLPIPGLISAAIVLALLGVAARYISPGQRRTALFALFAATFTYGLGDGLARMAAAAGDAEAATAWNTFRFLGIAIVPPALLHVAGAYTQVVDRLWFKPALALVYTGGLVFILLRVGTKALVVETHVSGGMVNVTVGEAFPFFGLFGLVFSSAAVYLFLRASRGAPSTLERGNASRGAVAAALPFGAALAYLALFHQATSPTVDPIVPFLTVANVVYGAILFSREVPAGTLAALRAVFTTLPDGLVIADRTGLVTFSNPAAAAMLGAAKAGLEGERIKESLERGTLPPSARAKVIDAFSQALSGHAGLIQFTIETPPPSARAVRAVVAAAEVGGFSHRREGPLALQDRFVFLALHDETDVRSREIMLSRANEVKDLFISMIGHDLKAPINAITGYGELIALDSQSTPDALAVYRYSQSVLASARQIQLMMENARLFSRLVDPQEILRAREPFEVAPLVEREAQNLRGAAERKGVTVTVERTPGAEGLRIVAAPIIRSVFQNLIDNAIKYTGDRTAVRVWIRGQDSKAVVEIEDEGPGIPPDKREAVFRRFTRLEQTRTKTEGLGLGLAISKQVVELHGGTIEVGDRPDGKPGALFRVRLPRELAPGAPQARGSVGKE